MYYAQPYSAPEKSFHSHRFIMQISASPKKDDFDIILAAALPDLST